MDVPARLHLLPEQFHAGEVLAAEYGPLSASLFRYPGGVCAVRLRNEQGEVVVLPFQGQHVWSLEMTPPGGARRTVHWRSMVRAPQPTRDFLITFGGFLQHCGLLAVGGPGPQDTHPLHGELPNAPFQHAWLQVGQDARGAYLGVGGQYEHAVAFAHHYTAEPLLKLYAGESLINVTMTATNRKQTPMEMFYMAHVNFLPVNHGRLVYSARSTPEHVRARTSIPAHIAPKPGYREFVEQLGRDPSVHETLLPGQAYDPEAVFFIDYIADAEGWAHTMQVHPDGTADYQRHRPAELPKATRWISRTEDQESLAMAEVGTTEPEGYTREKEKGNARILQPGEQYSCSFDAGVVGVEEARRLEAHIAQTIA